MLEKTKKILTKQIKITEVEELKEFVKNYKGGDKKYKDKIQVLFIIFFVPIILFFADYYNILTIVDPNIKNLNINFDWLSFAGAYGGAIVSAILLIFITQNDRAENTKITRASQRPYLDVAPLIYKSKFFDEKNEKTIVFEHGNNLEKLVKREDYLVLEIKNKGQTVAILDVNKTKVVLTYTLESINIEGEKIFIKEEKEILLNVVVKRIALSPDEIMCIKFCSAVLYKENKVSPLTNMIKTEIYYKDLFESKYVDECKFEEGKVNPIKDNKFIE